jgi:radical SAM superfamily enzyme YgiQ (UPF0313 family)
MILLVQGKKLRLMSDYHIVFAVVLGGDLVKSTEHLGVGYLAAVVRNEGYTAFIKEVKSEKNFGEFTNFIKDNSIRLVGFTTTCINIKLVADLSKEIKKGSPETTIVYGGHMATFSDEQIMKEIPYCDIIIRGEGEVTIQELVKSLEQKTDLSGIKGITYRRPSSEEIVKNEDRPLIEDLDKLPFPARDQFENTRQQYMRLCSSRGCYGNCAYCSNFVGRKHKGQRWRGRSPENIVDEIEYLVNKYNFHTFDFVDSTFEDPPDGSGKSRIRRIANEIIDRNLNIFYNCCFRAENWKEQDHELLDVLVKSGLEKINIGFEAGNNKSLKIFNKIATNEDNCTALKVIEKHPQIYITFGFIFYHPYQDFKDLRDNADFLYNSKIGQVTRHYFWPLEVYPSTLIKKKLIADGLLKESNIVDNIYSYNFLNPEVGVFARFMTKFLKEEIVWDFEIFDIIIHTYITRLLRKYEKNESAKAILYNFWDYVNQVRAGIAEQNYLFFIRWLDAAENGWSEEYVMKAKAFDLFNYLRQKKNEIKTEQLKVSLALKRIGLKLVGR